MKYLFLILLLSTNTAQSAPIEIVSWGSLKVLSFRAYDVNNIEVTDFKIHLGHDVSSTLDYSHSGPNQPIVKFGNVFNPSSSFSFSFLEGITASSSSANDYDRAYFFGFAPFEPFKPNNSNHALNQIGMSYSSGFNEIILSDINGKIDRFEFDYKIEYGVNYVNDNPDDFRVQTKIEIDTFGEVIEPGGPKNFIFISDDFLPENSFSFETLYTRHLSMDQITSSLSYSPSSQLFHEDTDITVQTVLNINPIPIPAALWLFGSALIGLASFTFKNKTS